MPGPYFVHRNAQGAVDSAAFAPSPGSEALPAGDPDLRRFFGTDGSNPDFADIDAGFVRVLEDLIDTLIQKNIIHHTDLPPEAQRKLVSRKGLRNRLQGSLNILRDDDGIL